MNQRFLLDRKQMSLGLMCIAVLIEVFFATHLLLTALTGEQWVCTSAAIAYIVASSIRHPLENWIYVQSPAHE